MREVRGQMVERQSVRLRGGRLKWWQLLWWIKGCFEPDLNSQINYMREDAWCIDGWCTWQNRANMPGKGEVKEGGAYM